MSTRRGIEITPARGRRLRSRVLGCAAAAGAGVLFAVAPAAGYLLWPGERAASRSAPNCSLRGSKTMQANRSVRVFRTTNDRVYGCRRTADRAYRLGVWGECQNNDAITRVEVAGRYAGFVNTTCSLYSSSQGVVLVNLRSGRVNFVAGPFPPPPVYAGQVDESQVDAVKRLVVDDRGGLAWIATRSAGGKTLAIEVRRRARGSGFHSVALDSGTAIDPGSLRRRDHRIFWRNGSRTSSATLG